MFYFHIKIEPNHYELFIYLFILNHHKEFARD
jgi:hypothetical protein